MVRVWELSEGGANGRRIRCGPAALLTDDAEAQLPVLVAQFAARVTREAPTADAANLLLSCGCLVCGTIVL